MPLLVLLLVASAAAAAGALLARRPAPSRAVALAVAAGLVLVLAALAVLVVHTHGVIGVDTSVARWADRHAGARSTDAVQVITQLGGATTVLVAGLLLVLADRRRTGRRGAAPFVLLVVLGDKLISVTLKALVDRARPTFNPVAATLDPSFPSGHSSTASAFWAAAAVVALRWVPAERRPPLVGAAVGIAVAVAASRVMLDVHWLTDVVAGLALGWAWATACTVLVGERLLGRPGAPDRRSRRAGRG